MNVFYQQAKWLQWFLAILMGLLFLGIMSLWVHFLPYGIPVYALFFLILPLYHLLCTPIFSLFGVYTYLSPMLLVYNASEKQYDLHNGTSFDYLMLMRKVAPGPRMRKKLLVYYLDGLLEVIRRIESGVLPATIIVRGSSYFFSKRTASKLGFELSPTKASERTNIYLNYFDLVWMYSLSKGRLAFPRVKSVKTASVSGERLLANREQIEYMRSLLKDRKLASK